MTRHIALLARGASVRSVVVTGERWGRGGWRAVAEGGGEGVHDTEALAVHLAACRACESGEGGARSGRRASRSPASWRRRAATSG